MASGVPERPVTSADRFARTLDTVIFLMPAISVFCFMFLPDGILINTVLVPVAIAVVVMDRRASMRSD